MNRTPAFELWQHCAHKRDRLIDAHTSVFSKTRGTILNHGIHCCSVGVRSVLVTPFAIMFGGSAVGFCTVLFWRKHHSATLTVVLWHLEQMSKGLPRNGGNEFDHIDTRYNLSAFPAAYRLTSYIELCSQLFLSETVSFASGDKCFVKCHDSSFYLGHRIDLTIYGQLY